ncbi:brachyurin [Stomoxys calcitrans]|uniref:Peptidase S1 domain-containing protein n=1 Tax=Stomoxys calcitrans TaxID=35570 RepID=A0A1I8Q0F4_STOCA|nr:brachyurin [Stomoxys calcitrans]XP_013107238.1 brachyurin [Stomoxys calcitrans]XP_013107247.1 brachyurin [Stomoxys calcitrans]
MKHWKLFAFVIFVAKQSSVEPKRNRNLLYQRPNGAYASEFFEVEDVANWQWHEEDYLVSNWRRKCSSIQSGNSSFKIRSFIAGGMLADMDKFPFLVGLLLIAQPRIFQCGGSLISKNYVLTAGHCLLRSTAGRVFVGSYVYANVASSEFVYNVTNSDFIINERYNGLNGFLDDIALIHLKQPVTLSPRVQIIALAPSFMTEKYLKSEIVTAAGWGRTADNSSEFNTKLFYVATPVLTFDKCMCFYLPGLVNRRKHLCADGTGGRGGCDGDSGGPLVYTHRGKDYLVGVTSFGSAGGCEIGHPTVYTRITNYLHWIYKKTGMETYRARGLN